MLLTSKFSHATLLLDPARVNAMLSKALIMDGILAPGIRGTITPHILSQRSSLLHTSQSPPLRARAAAVLLSIEAVSLHRKYPGIVGRVSPHAYRRENRRLILRPLFPPLRRTAPTYTITYSLSQCHHYMPPPVPVPVSLRPPQVPVCPHKWHHSSTPHPETIKMQRRLG